MLVTAKEVGDKRFATTRIKEGYDQDDVDSFLDRVEDTLAAQQSKIQQLEAQVHRLSSAETQVMAPLAPPESPIASAERLLRVAEATAEEHIAEAKGKAETLVVEGGAKVAQMIEEADDAAARIKADATKEAEEIVGEAAIRRDELQRQREVLAQQVQQLQERHRTMRGWLQSTLQKMDEEAANG